MVLPNLLHPVPVEVRASDAASTAYDEEAREPVQQLARAAVVTLQGQVSYVHDQRGGRRLARTQMGPSQEVIGYVLFRVKDLIAAGVTIKHNDRITRIGIRTVDYYVVREQDGAHYPDQGGASLAKYHFTDRQPSKQGA